MASYLSILIQAAEPANYKLNYDEHYLLSIPLATTTTPGIASFDSDYFSVTNGEVTLSEEYAGNLNNILEDIGDLQEGKVDKITPEDRGIFAYVVQKGAYDTVSNYAIEISKDASADTIARRYTDGRLKVGDGVDNADAVNKGQLTAATTDIPETALSVAVRTKLNEGISRVGISPEAWEALPDADKDINTMYFVGPYGTSPNQYFVEWMYFVNNGTGVWEAIGSTQSVDLSNYFTKSEINALLANYYTKSEMTTKLSDYAKQNGYYPTMRAGFTDQIYTDREIEDAATACPPVVFGTVGGNAEVQSGLMKFSELRGNTIKWNQLMQNGNFTNTDNWSTAGASLSVSNNVGTIANTNGYVYARVQTIVPRISGHKYFVILTAKDNSGTGNKLHVNWYRSGDSGTADSLVYETLSSSWQFFSTIFSSSDTSDNSRVNIYPNNDNSTVIGDAVDVKNVMVLDLTDIYGAGNEPSTTAEVIRDFPLPYYAYNAGMLLSSKSSSVDFVERNQWDEEWEVGGYDVNTGEKKVDSTCVRSKNFIRVLPNTTYFTNKPLTYLEYDGNQTFTGYYHYEETAGTFTTHSDTAYIAFYLTTTYGTTYNNDVCIYINWDTPNLPYVSYSKQQITLPNIELRSAGSAYDVLYQQGGGKRRVGTVDLGSLDWSTASVSGDDQTIHGFLSDDVIAKGTGGEGTTLGNGICSHYDLVTNEQSYNKVLGIAITQSGRLSVYDPSKNTMTSSEFKTSMSGVMLYYELATENDITVEENPGWTEYAEIDNFGTVKFNQDPAQTIPVPQAYFIRYTVNLVEFLDSLYVHCGGDVSKIALVSP